LIWFENQEIIAMAKQKRQDFVKTFKKESQTEVREFDGY
jgi:hypothetical protein